jgi:hypothetical protein
MFKRFRLRRSRGNDAAALHVSDVGQHQNETASEVSRSSESDLPLGDLFLSGVKNAMKEFGSHGFSFVRFLQTIDPRSLCRV